MASEKIVGNYEVTVKPVSVGKGYCYNLHGLISKHQSLDGRYRCGFKTVKGAMRSAEKRVEKDSKKRSGGLAGRRHAKRRR